MDGPRKRRIIRLAVIGFLAAAVVALALMLCLGLYFGRLFEGWNILDAINSN
jgi:hypothetical protein